MSGIVKRLGELTLGALDFEIEPGTVVALVGPNGSGKSSIFRMLMNLSKPDQGELRVLGKVYGSDKDEADVKRRMGYVPEESSWDELGCTTIRQLHHFVSRWYPSWNETLYRQLMIDFELHEGMKLSTLSKGMKRKLSCILAISYEPQVLLLDEATSGLDPFASKRMIEQLVRYMDGGERSIFFSTHVMEEVRRLADYIVYVNRGRFVGVFEKDRLLDDWKKIWVREAPQAAAGQLPGVVAIEQGKDGGLVQIISEASAETEAALSVQGIVPIRVTGMELEDILEILGRQDREASEE
nr:ABC transporter ATP-binding protein [Paenibacillus lutrae]